MTVIAAASVTLLFVIALTAVIAANARINVATHWDEMRCSPYVIPIAGLYKPSGDPRTAVQFARDNVSFCQKEFIQAAISEAAAGAREVVAEQGAIAAVVQDMVSVFGDIFSDVWNFAQGAYATFTERIGVVTQLFRNMMMNLHSLIDRLQGAVLNLMMGLISMVVAFINSVQVFLMVAIIIVGILIIMQILMFFLIFPISGLIVTMSAIASIAVVTAVTIIAAVEVAGGCFTGDTLIATATGPQPIRSLRLGATLKGEGQITAIHRFRTPDPLFKLGSSIVSGEHLVFQGSKQIAVKNHPDRSLVAGSGSHINDLWCLTTTNRIIPTPDGIIYADWEEILEDDAERLQEWYAAVWHRLNRSPPTILKAPDSILHSEAGLSPVCTVRRYGFFCGLPIRTETVMLDRIQIGDTVEDGPGWATVIGIVETAGAEVEAAVLLTGQQMSVATWIYEGDQWKPAGFVREASDHLQPLRWLHLYTDSGSFSLASGLRVRDASDVGLPALSTLVESIIL